MWEELPSCKIPNTLCLVKSITKKIVNCKGDNIFLIEEKGGLEYELRKEFKDTNEVNKRIDGFC